MRIQARRRELLTIILGESSLVSRLHDVLERREEARVVGGHEEAQWHDEDGTIEHVDTLVALEIRAVSDWSRLTWSRLTTTPTHLSEKSLLLIEALVLDLFVDRVAHFEPPVAVGSGKGTLVGETKSSVDGHPERARGQRGIVDSGGGFSHQHMIYKRWRGQ